MAFNRELCGSVERLEQTDQMELRQEQGDEYLITDLIRNHNIFVPHEKSSEIRRIIRLPHPSASVFQAPRGKALSITNDGSRPAFLMINFLDDER